MQDKELDRMGARTTRHRAAGAGATSLKLRVIRTRTLAQPHRCSEAQEQECGRRGTRATRHWTRGVGAAAQELQGTGTRAQV